MPETDTKIEERVEAIARVIHAHGVVTYGVTRDWDCVATKLQDQYRAEALMILDSPAFKEMIAEARGEEREACARAIEQIAWSAPTANGEWALREVAKVASHTIRARSDAVSASLPVGEGWQVVPKEPTPEMRAAGAPSCYQAYDGNQALALSDAEDCYRDMLAAAPPPPQSVVSADSDGDAGSVETSPAALRAHAEPMATFCRDIIADYCWGYAREPDGGDVQELATKLGLIEPHVATAEDAKDQAEFEPGDTIYKFASWLNKPPGAPAIGCADEGGEQ